MTPSGQGAEYAFSGVRMNMIPKEGSNRSKFETIAYGSREIFETNNLGDLQASASSRTRRRNSPSTSIR